MRRSGLFLIELVIVILFFSVSASVCMRIFAISKLTTERGRDIDRAAAAAQNAAECFKAADGDLEQVATMLGSSEVSGSDDGNYVSFDIGSSLILTLTLNLDSAKSIPHTSFCDITVCDSEGEQIYSITAAALIE